LLKVMMSAVTSAGAQRHLRANCVQSTSNDVPVP
jgi:hypothetical protein